MLVRRGVSKKRADDVTECLCAKLQADDVDIKERSLEMQMWWRDHQAADAKRLEQEKRKAADDAAREAALAKLTEDERDLLGLRK